MCGRTSIEQSDQSGECAPHLSEFAIGAFPEHFSVGRFRPRAASRRKRLGSPATYAGGRFTIRLEDGMVFTQ
jgi:hypothetical protein